MSTPAANDDPLLRRRQLHRRIDRSRRRIDARLRTVQDRIRQLLSWQTYVVRHPGWALAAALGAGLAASAAFRRRRLLRRWTVFLIRGFFGGFHVSKAPLGNELREAVAARRELARLELQADLRAVRRLVVACSIAAVFGLTALPLAAVGAAEALGGYGTISRIGWLFVFAGGFLILAVGVGGLAWRRFRRKFLGLRETFEELQEDLTWLREKTDHTCSGTTNGSR